MNQKTFYHIIEWAVALAACVFLGYKLVTFEDYPALWESLRGMAWQHYLALGLCVALMPVNMAIEAWRWMTLWNEGVKELTNERVNELTNERVKEIVALLPKIKVGFVRVGDAQHVTLNGEDVESQIRTLEVGNRASEISQIKEVRAFLVAQQQAMGANQSIVMDGRDIGTVVFPKADLKLFLTARPEVRAQRRYDELVAKGEKPVYEEVLADVNDRDYRDTHRAESPLRQAEDAIVVDNSDMTPDEQMKVIYDLYDRL